MSLPVSYINKKKIYHRDIKPNNFLIKKQDDERIYLYLHDFGLAREQYREDYI